MQRNKQNKTTTEGLFPLHSQFANRMRFFKDFLMSPTVFEKLPRLVAPLINKSDQKREIRQKLHFACMQISNKRSHAISEL